MICPPMQFSVGRDIDVFGSDVREEPACRSGPDQESSRRCLASRSLSSGIASRGVPARSSMQRRTTSVTVLRDSPCPNSRISRSTTWSTTDRSADDRTCRATCLGCRDCKVARSATAAAEADRLRRCGRGSRICGGTASIRRAICGRAGPASGSNPSCWAVKASPRESLVLLPVTIAGPRLPRIVSKVPRRQGPCRAARSRSVLPMTSVLNKPMIDSARALS